MDAHTAGPGSGHCTSWHLWQRLVVRSLQPENATRTGNQRDPGRCLRLAVTRGRWSQTHGVTGGAQCVPGADCGRLGAIVAPTWRLALARKDCTRSTAPNRNALAKCIRRGGTQPTRCKPEFASLRSADRCCIRALHATSGGQHQTGQSEP